MSAIDSVVWGGIALVVLSLAFRWDALRGSWFCFDDLAFISRAANMPLDADYLLESYGGHLMPGGFLTTRWALDLWGMDWTPWMMVMLAMQALAGFGFLRLQLSMFGRRRLVLVPLALYLFWAFTMPAGVWWAAAINQTPWQIALAFGLHGWIAYLRTRRLRHLFVALAWVVAGLFFYEKTLLVLGVFGLVALAWFTRGRFPDRLRTLVTTYRAGLVGCVVVGVAYIAFYAHYGLSFAPGEANDQPLAPLAFKLIFKALATAAIGGPFHWHPVTIGATADPSELEMLLAWVVIGTLVVYAARTRTLSKRAWSLIGFTSAANVLLLAAGRAFLVGSDIALEYRYQTEAAILLPLCLMLAFVPLLGATEVNEPAKELADPATRPYEIAPYVAMATVVVVGASLWSASSYSSLWQDQNPARSYFANVRTTAEKADDFPVPVIDLGLPQNLMWSYRYPENTYSHVFKRWTHRLTFPTATVDRINVFDTTGKLTPAIIPDTRTSLPPKDGDCQRLTGDATDVTLNGHVIGGGWWVRASYTSRQSTPVTITAGEDTHELTLPSGYHNMFFKADGEFDAITFSNANPEARVCLRDLSLGDPAPAGDAS